MITDLHIRRMAITLFALALAIAPLLKPILP